MIHFSFQILRHSPTPFYTVSKDVWACLLGCKKLLNFTWLTMKFHNPLHANSQIEPRTAQLTPSRIHSVYPCLERGLKITQGYLPPKQFQINAVIGWSNLKLRYVWLRKSKKYPFHNLQINKGDSRPYFEEKKKCRGRHCCQISKQSV